MSTDAPNPYAPPTTEPLPPPVVEFRQFPLASPWIRLGSAIIDGVINLVIFSLIGFAFSAFGIAPPWEDPSHVGFAINFGEALTGVLVFYAVQWRWLSLNGQTIGKKLTRIRIVTMAGEKPSMIDLALKRYGFMNLLSFIPIVGGLIALADLLSIFRKDHRCLHDQVAGTQVVRVVE